MRTEAENKIADLENEIIRIDEEKFFPVSVLIFL